MSLPPKTVFYKELVAEPDACDICQSIADAGPVPVDEPFVDDEGNEYDSSPIHQNCNCSTLAAAPPDDTEDADENDEE